ncbi:MAG: transporter, partial [Deltaproteobacteria bacterium]|nr:transporter [Deltaproteobacteria bacterium]
SSGSCAVLPAGVRNPRIKDIVMYMDEKFGGNGGAEALGQKLNKTVSWRDVIDGGDDATLKAMTQGKVQQLGFNLDDQAGSTTGVVNTYVNVKVPVIAAGITDKLTVALAVPIVTVQVNADTGLAKSPQADQLIASVCESDPDKCQESSAKLNNAVNTKLQRLGYNPINSYTKTHVGDVKAVGKYQVWTGHNDGFAVKGEVTAPTGTPPNADNALDTPTGDGQTDVGAMLIYDRYLNAHHSLKSNVYGGYTVQTGDHIERRLPVSDTDSLSNDKELLARKLGDVIAAGASLSYEFPFGLNFSAGYGFQRMAPTQYDGGKFADYRYRLLEANTGQVLHSATLGLGFSTVEMYKNHQFKAPFQLNMSYCKPLAGINVVKNDFMAFELVLFF